MKIISDEVTFLVELDHRETKKLNEAFESSRDIEAFAEQNRIDGVSITFRERHDEIMVVTICVDLKVKPIREARGFAESIKKAIQESIKHIPVKRL